MKNLLIFGFLAFLLSACSKERCQTCKIVTESSFEEANRKCEGSANSHPQFKVVGTTNLGELCGDEIEQVKANAATSSDTQLCPGVIYTIRTHLEFQ
jgi:hypothetical protein